MQVIIMFILFTTQAFAYECKSQELKLNLNDDTRNNAVSLKSQSRKSLFQGLIFELTQKEVKNNFSYAKKIAEYLIHTEVNKDKRAFIKLLSSASDLESDNPKSLELKEICELNEKVSNLSGSR